MSFRKTVFIISAVAVIIFLGANLYYAGYKLGVKSPETVIVKGFSNIDDENVKADFSIFWKALDILKANHLHGAEINDKDYMYGAIEGLAGALKDPNTVFLRGKDENGGISDAEKFQQDIQGKFGGIGAEIGFKDKQLVIVSPLKKSPAERSGLKAGDQIVKIDDVLTAGITNVGDAVKKIRGPVGTTVVLNIYRDDWANPKDFKITREEIKIPNLDSEMKAGNILYLQIYNFNANLAASLHEAALQALPKGVRGIVLDLRNNPGGFLQEAINTAGWFLRRGAPVVGERFRDRPGTDFRANGNGVFAATPIVILVNQGSASASEILAGALRDNRQVKLIGEKTFGKGSVQELSDLPDGSQLKVTIAEWVLPSGKTIEKQGLVPDVEVKITEKDFENKKDPQLEKALEIIRSEILGK